MDPIANINWLKDRYGDDAAGGGEDDDSDESSSSSEDEDAEELTKELSLEWFKTMAAIKKKERYLAAISILYSVYNKGRLEIVMSYFLHFL